MTNIFRYLINLIIPSYYSNVKFFLGQHYLKLNVPAKNAANITEFFSFNCPHCYQFEHVYHISDIIKKSLPKNITFTKYHISRVGPLGSELNQAWAVAKFLGIENKISFLFFDSIGKNKKFNHINDIIKIFSNFKINAEDYKSICKNYKVKLIVKQQDDAVLDFKLRKVPSIFINGKYLIINSEFRDLSLGNNLNDYINIIKFLINKN